MVMGHVWVMKVSEKKGEATGLEIVKRQEWKTRLCKEMDKRNGRAGAVFIDLRKALNGGFT